MAEFENMNIPLWRQRGFTGKGTNIVVLDVSGKPFKEHNIINPLQHLETHDKNGGHKTMVCAILREMLPEATIYAMRFNSSYSEQCIDWIIENKDMIDVVNCSFSTNQSGYDSLDRLKDTDIPIMVAVGNDSKPYSNKTAELPFATGIGAWQEYGDRITSYSNYGVNLDFVAYSHIKYISPNNGNVVDMSGTSCSAPVASALIGIYGQLFRSVNNRPMNRQEAFEFQLKYVSDKEAIGRDDESGYGLLRLPGQIPQLTKEEDEMVFEDTKKHWAKEQIDAVSNKGIMKGYEDGSFKPDQPITRAEMAVVVYRIINEIIK